MMTRSPANQQLALGIFGQRFVHHGVERIVDDVQENLFELMRIASDGRHPGLKVALQCDAAHFHVVVTQEQCLFQHLDNIELVLLRLALTGK